MSAVDIPFHRVAWHASVLVSMLGCGGSSDLSNPVDEPTSIDVYTSTEGVDIDRDGYGVSVDGEAAIPIGATDTLSLPDLEPGSHTLVLDGWAQNCTPTTSPSQRVEALAGKPSAVHFAVSCVAVPALIAQVRTVGVGWDLDGYLLTLDQGEPELIVFADTLVYQTLPTGEHEVSLAGLADNCRPEGPSPLSLSVAPGSTAVADFVVRCTIPYRMLAIKEPETDDPDTMFVMNSDGSGVQALVTGQFISPTWSPDARRIAYWGDDEGPLELIIMNSDGTGATTIFTASQAPEGGLHWSPDGTKIAFGLGVPDYDTDPDGELYVVGVDGRGLVRLSDESAFGRADWSPDGLTLALTTDASDMGQSDVYLIRPDGTGLTPLAATDGFEEGGIWSPDGTSLAFRRTVDGSPTIYDGPSAVYLVDPDGTNLRQLTQGPYDLFGGWSPDGSQILYTSVLSGPGEGIPHLHVINADGTGDETLPVADFDHASWSPDGRAIASIDAPGIWVMNPDGSGRTKISNYTGLMWAPAPTASP